MSRLLGTALAVALCCACGGAAYRLERGIVREGIAAGDMTRQRQLVAEGDRLWAQRSDPARLAAALQRWESAIAIKDDDWQTYHRLARGYFFQADAVFAFQASGGIYPYHGGPAVDASARKRYREAHRRGLDAALRGLAARSREFEQRVKAGIDMDRAVRVVGKDAAGLLYWYVANLGPWARSAGVRALLKSRSAILGALIHLRNVDPGYFYAGADRLLGVYYAAAPGIIGGSIERARAHFEAALRSAPSYLGTPVLAAEFLDRKARDRASFERRLHAVLARPSSRAPDLGPENEIERRKARALLGRAPSYFAQ
ncbi:MAG TPA: TRAP transporter TatT component family protein [Kofleriaceae bacterium]|nr:TRAP transporter TatT component family protein [Kofleriaceae bacterium]